jgi:hypothetical protein
MATSKTAESNMREDRRQASQTGHAGGLPFAAARSAFLRMTIVTTDS